MIVAVSKIATSENTSGALEDSSWSSEALPVAPRKENRNTCGALKTKVAIE
jgi:hypothetical protein